MKFYLDAMVEHMESQAYAPKTIALYVSCIRVFARELGKSPLRASRGDAETFIQGLRNRGRKETTVRVYFEAMKFFYRFFGMTDRIPLVRCKSGRGRLPRVLDQASVRRMLECCYDLMDRAFFSLVYSAGLRISEAINLRQEDIDFDRKTVFIKSGKNGKDRYSVLGKSMAALLRRYIEAYGPEDRLFSSPSRGERLTQDWVRRRFRKIVDAAGIQQAVTVHTLRHCFATHLIEGGTNLFHVMKLLGHSDIQTTMVYVHMIAPYSFGVESPMDRLELTYNEETTENPAKTGRERGFVQVVADSRPGKGLTARADGFEAIEPQTA